jgi:oligopeptide/dipeptide ABC transporter ATP-binding protein
MYLGKIIEIAPSKTLNMDAAHPYTRALLAAKPSINPSKSKSIVPLVGDVPSPLNPPSGCHFHPRCPEATNRCREEQPVITQLEDQHSVNCHLYS